MSQDNHRTRAVFAVQALTNQPIYHAIENKSLMIRTRKEPHLYLSLCYGELKLLPKPGSGSFWDCVRTSGWYGFRNTVSGTYLHINGTANTICAEQRQRLGSNYFTAEMDVNGGCILNVYKAPSHELLRVSVSEDRKSLSTLEPAGEPWDFIEIKYV
ncbi:hypothetical protein TRIATDRAFT_37677 [Trichoderma atroviride IMI 206040]|uniref:Uncharacterized protein n=1 Tax=Hypocrea atroviridis (strain ATCC 20476 / IMI 206040) TaxID=452589 RepID=G9NXJ2_HYPAI|nr:uncharacterized protein TRIATDRAFT_37677 [Trichoderma atroviride IMI 206040]EHK44172.1 hypothetical protein TRIATDRAFT_37677 [Trichoderma atroviride IMI 206040]